MKVWKVYIDYRQVTAFDDGRLDIEWTDENGWKKIVEDRLKSDDVRLGYVTKIYVKNPCGEIIEKHVLLRG